MSQTPSASSMRSATAATSPRRSSRPSSQTPSACASTGSARPGWSSARSRRSRPNTCSTTASTTGSSSPIQQAVAPDAPLREGAVGLLDAAVGGVERLDGGADVVGDAVGGILSRDATSIGVCGAGLGPSGAYGRGPRAFQGADDDVESAERTGTVHDEGTLLGVTR